MLEDLYVDVQSRNQHLFDLGEIRQMAWNAPKVQAIPSRVKKRALLGDEMRLFLDNGDKCLP